MKPNNEHESFLDYTTRINKLSEKNLCLRTTLVIVTGLRHMKPGMRVLLCGGVDVLINSRLKQTAEFFTHKINTKEWEKKRKNSMVVS